MGHAVTTNRLDVWRDLIRDNFVALDIATDRQDTFTGRVTSTDIGPLNVASVTSGPQAFTRTPQLAHLDDDVYLQVGLVARGSGLLQQDGREAQLAAGDFAVYETDRPFRWELRQDWELLVFTWPRAIVQLPDTRSQALTARCLSGSTGLGAVVGRMLRDLVTTDPELSADGSIRFGHEIAELVTTVAAERVPPPGQECAAASLLRRIDGYILARLNDPTLAPPDIAEAHFISTRHLHRLFATRGTTVSQQIQRLRLERARLELRHPSYRNRSITDISRTWGFPDLPTFSRAFRNAYGTTPTRYRSAHASQTPTLDR